MKIGDKVRILVAYNTLRKDEIGYLKKKSKEEAEGSTGGWYTYSNDKQSVEFMYDFELELITNKVTELNYEIY